MSSIRERALALFREHQHMMDTNYTEFRRTVMRAIGEEFSVSVASQATHFNTARLTVAGLLNPDTATPKGVRVVRQARGQRADKSIADDLSCFAVLELVGEGGSEPVVGRYRSFLSQAEAEQHYQQRFTAWPGSIWVLVRGLGPNSGDPYRLEPGEQELQRYPLA